MRSDLKRTIAEQSAGWPTLVHVTHWKAGSQWIHRILRGIASDRVIQPENENAQFLRRPIRPAIIYPTVYVTKQEFDKTALPPFSARFVVIRDLRDTLVSHYFSVKISHTEDTPEIREWRSGLQALSNEDGLLRMLDFPDFQKSAAIQQSWQQSAEPLLRYEELIQQDEELIENLLLH